MSNSPRIVFLIALGLAASRFLPGQGTAVFPFQLRSAGSYLGIGLADLDSNRARELKLTELVGVEIVSVMDGMPAYQAGLRPADVVLSYNGEKVLGREQLARLVAETPPGRRVNLVCWRAGEEKRISVTTGSSRPSSSDELALISALRVTDVPSTIMLWRNMMLGIESESLNEQLAQALGVKQGILIWSVASGSAAEHAGLKAGDVVTDFCGHAIHSPREVGFTLQQVQSAQKPVSVQITRDHKTISVSVSLSPIER